MFDSCDEDDVYLEGFREFVLDMVGEGYLTIVNLDEKCVTLGDTKVYLDNLFSLPDGSLVNFELDYEGTEFNYERKLKRALALKEYAIETVRVDHDCASDEYMYRFVEDELFRIMDGEEVESYTSLVKPYRAIAEYEELPTQIEGYICTISHSPDLPIIATCAAKVLLEKKYPVQEGYVPISLLSQPILLSLDYQIDYMQEKTGHKESGALTIAACILADDQSLSTKCRCYAFYSDEPLHFATRGSDLELRLRIRDSKEMDWEQALKRPMEAPSPAAALFASLCDKTIVIGGPLVPAHEEYPPPAELANGGELLNLQSVCDALDVELEKAIHDNNRFVKHFETSSELFSFVRNESIRRMRKHAEDGMMVGKPSLGFLSALKAWPHTPYFRDDLAFMTARKELTRRLIASHYIGVKNGKELTILDKGEKAGFDEACFEYKANRKWWKDVVIPRNVVIELL